MATIGVAVKNNAVYQRRATTITKVLKVGGQKKKLCRAAMYGEYFTSKRPSDDV
jgi:hypothetical protein